MRSDVEIRRRSQATAAALQSRNHYKEIVDAIEQEHWVDSPSGRGRCNCGTAGCEVSGLLDEIRDRQRQRDYDSGRLYEGDEISELFALANERARERREKWRRMRSTG